MLKKNIIIFFIASFLYLLITIPVFFNDNHLLKNLEPYPDGILFSLSARNLSLGKGLKLITNWGEVGFWVPPLYSWYLSIFYLFSKEITTFYFANIFLGLGTIFIIYLIIKKTTKNFFSIILGVTIYFSHLIIFWLPGLAMTENLSLFLFCLLLLGLVEKNIKIKLLLILATSIGLLLVRFSTFPIIVSTIFLISVQLKNKLLVYSKQIIFLLVVLILIGIYILQSDVGKTLKFEILTSLFNPDYFNSEFIYQNLIQYVRGLFFHQGQFLWIKIGISSWPILGLFSYSIYKLYKFKKFNKLYLLIILFISLFPLQLLFYTVDARYIIYSIILLSLAGAWAIDDVKNKNIIYLFLIAISLNIFFQRNFLKQIIADNWLKKSTAWQYRSVIHFNDYLSKDKMIITALPPFLVDAYQTKNYRSLPLSNSQEFLQKNKFIWGKDINYNNLINGYKNWLEEGKELYISNAYITHQRPVIEDFEEYKKEFDLKLVSEGCFQACNIYKLELLKK